MLVDFPDDAPVSSEEQAVLACPVSFPAPVTVLSDTERLRGTLNQEIQELRAWYDMAVTKSGRTTVGVSELDPEEIGKFVGAFLGGDIPASPQDDMPVLDLFKLAVEDLKAYYFEAVAAQPGQRTASSSELANWLWRETTAGKVLFKLQEQWKGSDDSNIMLFSSLLLVPRAYDAESPYAVATA